MEFWLPDPGFKIFGQRLCSLFVLFQCSFLLQQALLENGYISQQLTEPSDKEVAHKHPNLVTSCLGQALAP